MALENHVISSNIVSERIGQIFAFIIAMTALMAGYFLIHDGHDGPGIGIIVGDALTMIGMFIYAQRSQAKQLRAQIDAFLRQPQPPQQ